ncbi:MAG: methyltransferase [Rhodoluna sp.]|nr:methyltransferase [Rhodoluna sp.]MBP6186334.1 methyltransferase [Rhodoluna sp.]
MSGEHYFSEQPTGEFKPKKIFTAIDGQRVELFTAGGTFSPDHMDTGTAILLEHAGQAPSTGNLLDLGCGWGPIALTLAKKNPEATVWAIDVNERSLELTRMNAEKLGLTNIRAIHIDEVPADLRFTGIWSNPPIRVGKEALHEILSKWLVRLEDECEAYLVVSKDLGADSLLKWMQSQFENLQSERIETAKGFRIIRSAKF